MDAEFLNDFRRTVDEAAARLLACSDESAGRPPVPGKWSKKEIIGHLIDSAANNHARFVRAQATDDLVFEGYDQDAWVRIQRYGERPFSELVHLWQHYNHHLATVMETADPSALTRSRVRHNLDAIAFRSIDRDHPATLDYFIRDYVEHLKHHLRQTV